jgi:15-cis-phytoene synthase
MFMTPLIDPDRQLALGYAGARLRPALETLWALDEALGQVVQATREPILGQLRLAWWRDQISNVHGSVTPVDPVLVRLTATFDDRSDFAELSGLADAWTSLLGDLPLSDGVLTQYAAGRGALLFRVAAKHVGAQIPDELGAGWALADFGFRCSDPDTARRALFLANDNLSKAGLAAVPLSLTALGVLARLKKGDIKDGHLVHGSPRKIGRALRYALLRR